MSPARLFPAPAAAGPVRAHAYTPGWRTLPHAHLRLRFGPKGWFPGHPMQRLCRHIRPAARLAKRRVDGRAALPCPVPL